MTEQEKYKRNYDQLDDRQKKFLDDSEIGQEVFLDLIRKLREMKMKVNECYFVNLNSKVFKRNFALKGLVEHMHDASGRVLKDSYLTKKTSRKSFSSSMFLQNKSKSNRGLFNCLNTY